MKIKIIDASIFLILVILVCVFSYNVVAVKESDLVRVEIENKEVQFTDSRPFIDGKWRTQVPLREVLEAYGADIRYMTDLEKIEISYARDNKEKLLSMKIGDRFFWKGEELINMDTSAIIRNDRTYLPIRPIIEALGGNVDWHDSTRTIHISYNNSEEKKVDFYDRFISSSLKYQEVREFDLSRGKADRIPVLMYHHIVTEEEMVEWEGNESVISLEAFEKQKKVLYENGFTTLRLLELEMWIRGEIDLPEKSVVITFDDGYLSNYIYAYPVLKKYGFYASNFLVTNSIRENSEAFNYKSLQYLSWEDIANSTDRFEYANHTHNMHRREAQENHESRRGFLVTKPEIEVFEDLKTNKEITNSRYFAYPYGHYNDFVIDSLMELGYGMAFAVEEGSARVGDDLFTVKRYGIVQKTCIERFKAILRIE